MVRGVGIRIELITNRNLIFHIGEFAKVQMQKQIKNKENAINKESGKMPRHPIGRRQFENGKKIDDEFSRGRVDRLCANQLDLINHLPDHFVLDLVVQVDERLGVAGDADQDVPVAFRGLARLSQQFRADSVDLDLQAPQAKIGFEQGLIFSP